MIEEFIWVAVAIMFGSIALGVAIAVPIIVYAAAKDLLQ